VRIVDYTAFMAEKLVVSFSLKWMVEGKLTTSPEVLYSYKTSPSDMRWYMPDSIDYFQLCFSLSIMRMIPASEVDFSMPVQGISPHLY
jgi:hypothetical protein